MPAERPQTGVSGHRHIYHPVTTRFIGWTDPGPHPHIYHPDEHHIYDSRPPGCDAC
ncbi:MAG: hypothetical protein NZM43_02800 [Saprospiraceae bacterium]|nr:hypothetical protein [Saprospiraceae bacterium]MDW8483231.1 hypothetical protein [Saprospiraceae bacterium]